MRSTGRNYRYSYRSSVFVRKPFAGHSLESSSYNLWETDGKVERIESRKRRYLDIIWKAPFIALTTIGIGHLVNAAIEAFADSYFTHGTEWGFFLGLVEFVTFITILHIKVLTDCICQYIVFNC